MNEEQVNILVVGREQGRYALDPSGRVLVEGDHVDVLIAGYWNPFRVGKSHYTGTTESGLYVVPGNAEPLIGQFLIDEYNNPCGLCLGMRVRYSIKR